ncbi:MAG: HAD family hydrolase [Deltaproteobacteria bacterium]|nr:HAD family hydrolase [Deltaproteobacteria bacterium]
MPEYRAVFTDLDGTLLNEQGKITPETLDVLARLQARGIPLFVATGRSVCATKAALQQIDLRTPFVCYNGAVVYDPVSDEWLRHEKIDDHVTEELLAICESHALFYLVFHEDAKHTLPPRYDYQTAFYDRLENIRHVEAFDELPRRSVTKFSIFTADGDGDRAILGYLEQREDEHYVERFHISTIPGFREFSFHSTDVHARAGGKGAGVRFVMERHGFAREEIVAIGDHRNDVSMLEVAGLGVAMNDAPPELLAHADEIIDHEAGNGVARLLTRLFDL